MKVVLIISVFFIFYTMIGYPLVLKILNKTVKKDNVIMDLEYEPSITVIIPVHNEEKVIKKN